jgi:hypothetical protein
LLKGVWGGAKIIDKPCLPSWITLKGKVNPSRPTQPGAAAFVPARQFFVIFITCILSPPCGKNLTVIKLLKPSPQRNFAIEESAYV